MEYELKSAETIGSPSLVSGTTYEWQVKVETGIKGDTYEFVKFDSISVYFDVTQTGVQIQEKILIEAQEFVTKNYPNI